jgi:hypothetical protein
MTKGPDIGWLGEAGANNKTHAEAQRRGGGSEMEETPGRQRAGKSERAAVVRRDEAPELYQVVIECRDEGEQRELFERLRGEGRRVRLLVL